MTVLEAPAHEAGVLRVRDRNGERCTVQSMTEDEAVAYAALHGQLTLNPTVSPDELTGLLASCKRVDADDRLANDPDWIPTFWGTRLVAEIFALKLSKSYRKTDLSADGVTITGSQVVENLTALARQWRARCTTWSR